MTAVTIPQMPMIPKSLGLNVVAIDIDPDTLDIKSHETIPWSPETKVLVFSHVFGSRVDLTSLHSLCKSRGVLLVSDEAECYSPHSQPLLPCDVTLRSHGLIKNYTAISGATAHINDPRLLLKFRAVHGTWRVSSSSSYRLKILKSSLLIILSNPTVYGLVLKFLSLLSLSHDSLITSLLRGFPGPTFLSRIKQRPCPQIVSSVLRLSLVYTNFESPSKRKINSVYLNSLLPSKSLLGTKVSEHNHWLHPYIPPSKSELVSKGLKYNFDITGGATQLVCIDSECVEAERFMKGVVYLPVSEGMGKEEIGRLAEVCKGKGRKGGYEVGKVFWGAAAVGVTVVWVRWGVLRSLVTSIVVNLWMLIKIGAVLFGGLTYYVGRISRRNYERKGKSKLLKHLKTGAKVTPELRIQEPESPQEENIILTGATGFIGRVMLHTLLQHSTQLNIKNVYVVLRSKKDKVASQRGAELLASSIYSGLSTSIVTILQGDVSLPNLGLKSRPSTKITKVIHLAASVSFTQPLKDAYACNTRSTLNVVELCKSLEAKLCHFSTAFVHNDAKVYKQDLGKGWDAKAVQKSIETDCHYASKLLKSYPNTYSFSKHLTEKLLSLPGTSPKIPPLIIRPSIVGPSILHPTPNFSGSKGTTVTAGSAYYLSSLGSSVWHLPPNKASVVPVDLLVYYSLNKLFFENAEGAFNACFEKGVEGFEWEGFLEVNSEIGCLGGKDRGRVVLQEEVLCRTFSEEGGNDVEYYHDLYPVFLYNLRLTYLKLTNASKQTLDRFKKVRTFVDLPMLFMPFTKREFEFETDFKYSIEGEMYMVNCARAGSKFVGFNDEYKNVNVTDSRWSDLFWCLTMPVGNFWIRLVGFALVKILRMTTANVTVDVESFSDYARSASPDSKLILCPTHRSLFDFMIVSFITFSLPELKIYNPFIIADNQFSKLPLIGTICKGSGAIFIERGKGSKGVERAVKQVMCQRPVEVFIEGTRSRDRRFLKPKTGFLRAMLEVGGERDYDMLPINISYERTPEQETMASEMNVGQKKGLGIGGLVSWGWNVLSGKVKLGRVHVTAGSVVNMSKKSNLNHVAKQVQQQQMTGVRVSGYHVKALQQSLGIDEEVIKTSLEDLKVPFWEGDCKLKAPQSKNERWTLSLAVAHAVAPHVKSQEWADWLCSSRPPPPRNTSESVDAFVQAWERAFERAEHAVETAIEKLVKLGFEVDGLKVEHVLGYVEDRVGRPIEEEAVKIVLARQKRESRRVAQEQEPNAGEALAKSGAPIPTGQEEAFGAWGFADSKFVLDGKTVTLHSDRYSLGHRRLPKLVDFLEKEMKTKIDLARSVYPLPERVRVTPSRLPPAIKEGLMALFGVECVKTDDVERVRHGTGHCLSDVLKIRTNEVKRAPDVVVYVTSQDTVVELVKFAKSQRLCLIPFGGGTNVTEALQCPSYDVEPRCIVSVDMRRMNKIIWVNKEDGVAKIEAGATGRTIQEELAQMGLTMGHQPDSYEFSTLGGWVATRASGMLKNKYGNIEDIVREVVVVDGSGEIMWQHHKEEDQGKSFGRGSFGMPELKDLVIGSEGNLCIVTSCVVRVRKVPEKTEFSSVVFNDFGAGLGFMRAVQSSGLKPASIRMMDNAQFKLGQVFKGSEGGSGLKKVVQGAALWWKGIETSSMVAVTLKFEGSAIEVDAQQKAVSAATKDWGGLAGGGENGKAGYELTFAIAYLRDFALSFGLLAESFETFVNYSKLNVMVECVKQRVREAHVERGVCGEALVSARVTQLYEDGACVYFYYIMDSSGLKDGNRTFSEIEEIARGTILENGGNLSHHHGVGKHRAKFVKERVGGSVVDVMRGVKKEIDGDNVFGVRNGVFE
ncbi:hypothetical protein TrST_g6711 [Triparma strigata]|uniref:alkylglycerone-phosphate synthase n=1 Tax=Triparma strigata TaxID=1606541 RepID=A0A9W7E140_9STRA|nr:hypothetical protein TrST_g6711 [Triparma strigata]